MTEAEFQAGAQVDSDATLTRAVPPEAPPDEQNPAIIDARKTFAITLISTALFVGAVVLFIL